MNRGAYELAAMSLSVVVVGCSPSTIPMQADADSGAPDAASAPLSGEQAFEACTGCHSIGSGEPHKVGPNLYGVVGSPAGKSEGYSYSPALVDSGIVWTRENLFAWIANSEALVPQSWMLYPNSLSGEEVMALIDYLAVTSSVEQ